MQSLYIRMKGEVIAYPMIKSTSGRVTMVSLYDIKNNPEIACYIDMANHHLGAMGYTDHSFRHVEIVSQKAYEIMASLGYPPRMAELSAIAGYMHDIGNVVSRYNHGQTGAVLAYGLLSKLGMDCREIALLMGAIGNHDEGRGEIVNDLTAALVLADKSDVHRSRVRNPDFAKFDIHDRINYAVESSALVVDAVLRVITLYLTIDISIVSVMEYFEIFMLRMIMCRRAAGYLKCQFSIIINNARLL